MNDKYGNYWVVFMDNGYQDTTEVLRAVVPKKKPARGILSRSDEKYNKKLSSDRILVEIYFRRLEKLCTECPTKYAWIENLGDKIVSLSIVFTKFVVEPGFSLFHALLSVQATVWLCMGTTNKSFRSIDQSRHS